MDHRQENRSPQALREIRCFFHTVLCLLTLNRSFFDHGFAGFDVQRPLLRLRQPQLAFADLQGHPQISRIPLRTGFPHVTHTINATPALPRNTAVPGSPLQSQDTATPALRSTPKKYEGGEGLSN